MGSLSNAKFGSCEIHGSPAIVCRDEGIVFKSATAHSVSDILASFWGEFRDFCPMAADELNFCLGFRSRPVAEPLYSKPVIDNAKSSRTQTPGRWPIQCYWVILSVFRSKH